MSEQSTTIVSKVWGMCNPLRDDGVSYGDYLEQLTYLIFLKMSDEYSKPPYNKHTGIPDGYTWSDMNTLKGAELEALGSAPAPMPGRRRITMSTESENAATGTEDVIAPEGQTLKLIENGQLIIIRGGEMYNAQGQKL